LTQKTQENAKKHTTALAKPVELQIISCRNKLSDCVGSSFLVLLGRLKEEMFKIFLKNEKKNVSFHA
jgi:hypothetical protein